MRQLDRRDAPRTYTPAYVHYVIVFSPKLGQSHAAEDTARLTEQIIAYTSRESAVPQAQMVRQVALANALIAFGTEMHGSHSHSRRRLAAGSRLRRLLLIEVEPDLWLHACISLARLDSGPSTSTAPWLSDNWAHQQMHNAWDVWRLRHGSAFAMLELQGRVSLERSLESFFTKWAWAWDVEGQHAASVPDAHARAGLVAQTLPVTDAAAGPSMDAPIEWFSHVDVKGARPDVIVVHDDLVVWPARGAPFATDYHAVVAHVLGQLGDMQAAREHARATRRREQTQDGVITTTFSGLGRMWSDMASFGEQAASYMTWPSSDIPSTSTTITSATSPTSTGGTWSFFQDAAKPAWALMGSGAAALTHSVGMGKPTPAERPERATLAPALTNDVSATMQRSEASDTNAASMLSSLHEACTDAGAPDRRRDEPTTATTEAAVSAVAETSAEAAAKAAGTAEEDDSVATALATDDLDESFSASSTASVDVQLEPASGTAFAALHSRLAEALDEVPADAPKSPDAHKPQEQEPQEQQRTPSAGVARKELSEPPAAPWHDYALDGWGHEDPGPWKSERCHALDGSPLYVSYTRRGLLTGILVWRAPAHADEWLEPTWELLRRMQRVINDSERRPPAAGPPYLHISTNGLGINALGSAKDASSGIEAVLLDVEHMVHHGIRESLSRDESGRFWVAMRSSGRGRTYMVLRDVRDASIAECEHQLRQLAAQHPEFGL
ncbi:hypothetical protein MCUN1_002333 [Malassezia cuniculi]|uniref:CCZ1/INTU/HSP4 first Longin domain-containing protein n=1 Tax=Malassezia cuniculi TaxID=948313 RepID=A0AAF0EVK4_9BASI|nr:hypothetical protein MCUN1_002333 [Malassezia cuniculi]